MRDPDPVKGRDLVSYVDPVDQQRRSWIERLDYRWALLPLAPAFLAAFVARSARDPTAAAAALVLLLVVPPVAAALFFVALWVMRSSRRKAMLRRYEATLAVVRRVPVVPAARAADGRARVRGILRRVASNDAFAVHTPTFVVEDDSGVVIVDDDALVVCGMGGWIVADGTRVEVCGPGRRRAHPDAPRAANYRGDHEQVFVFDGSPSDPIYLCPADGEAEPPGASVPGVRARVAAEDVEVEELAEVADAHERDAAAS